MGLAEIFGLFYLSFSYNYREPYLLEQNTDNNREKHSFFNKKTTILYMQHYQKKPLNNVVFL